MLACQQLPACALFRADVICRCFCMSFGVDAFNTRLEHLSGVTVSYRFDCCNHDLLMRYIV
jgi:hypothetical protein